MLRKVSCNWCDANAAYALCVAKLACNWCDAKAARTLCDANAGCTLCEAKTTCNIGRPSYSRRRTRFRTRPGSRRSAPRRGTSGRPRRAACCPKNTHCHMDKPTSGHRSLSSVQRHTTTTYLIVQNRHATDPVHFIVHSIATQTNPQTDPVDIQVCSARQQQRTRSFKMKSLDLPTHAFIVTVQTKQAKRTPNSSAGAAPSAFQAAPRTAPRIHRQPRRWAAARLLAPTASALSIDCG